MRHILRLAGRFRSDERGVFAVVFGLFAVVLVAMAGAVVDFAAIEQTRGRTQEALDAAVLGLQPTIFDNGVTEETIEPAAQALLDERLGDSSITADIIDVTINKTEGMLRLEARIDVPTAFVALVGIQTVPANVLSEATRKRLNIEVAMVLDNSGSMSSSSRMTNLKAAAKCATNILFNSDCASTETTADTTSVKIGIVPFTEFVNVGTGYKTASWMDGAGASPIAGDNFDDDDDETTVFADPVDRFALYDQLDNVSWQGCVEARPYPYDTNDAVPDPATPGTMFVPEFAPDNPSMWGYSNSYLSDTPSACNQTGECTYVQVRTGCNNSGGSCDNGSDWSSTLTGVNAPASCTCNTNGPYTQTLTGPSGDKTRTRTWTCSVSYAPAGLSERALQERLCKYTGWADTSWGKGPNWDCPTNAMLPLTNTKSAVTAAIDAMYPQGYTNIHQGAIWGFHMLSPTEPLTEADAYDTATYKVMIVMTDGENTVNGYDADDMNRAAGYMAYGYPGSPSQGYNGRIYSGTYPEPASDPEVTSAMNARTLETCTNAKAAGITVYTIGLNSPNATTTSMLTDCATAPSFAYFPSASSELISVFTEIAAQLADLRLAR